MLEDVIAQQLDGFQNRYLELLINAGHKPVWLGSRILEGYIFMKDPYGTIYLEKLPSEPDEE